MKESKKKRVGEEWREQIGAYRSKKSVMEREIIEDRSEKIRANWSGQIISEKECATKIYITYITAYLLAMKSNKNVCLIKIRNTFTIVCLP